MLLVTALATAGCIASPAWAQDEEGTETRSNEIVVTAQFREQNLQKTPIAITAINSEMLEARSQTSIVDVGAQAPSVSLHEGNGNVGPGLQAYIRGIGQYDFTPAYEPGVGTYVDDVYYSTLLGSMFDLVDVDRIEILRGPQGTLAGKNSIGGAIKVYSKKPTGSGEGYLQATYGSFNRLEVNGAVDFPVIADKLFMRISGGAKDEDGYVTRLDFKCTHPSSPLPTYTARPDCVLGTEGGETYVAGRAALRWLASDAVEVNIAGDYTKDSSEANPNRLIAVRPDKAFSGMIPSISLNGVQIGDQFIPDDPYTTYSTYCNPVSSFGAYCVPAVTQINAWGVSGTIDAELSDFSIKSITAYRGYNARFNLDSDGSPIPITLNSYAPEGTQFSQEVRLNGQVNDRVEFTLGAFYLSSDNVGYARNDSQYGNGGAGTGDIQADTASAETYAGFAHLAINATDELTLTGGIRYTHESKLFTFHRQTHAGIGIPVVGLDGVSGSYAGGNWDYRLNASYQITPDVMAYAQFSTGFKGGGVNPRPFFPNQVFGFSPETLTSYEGGLKTQLAEDRIRLNLAGFYSDYKDIQLVVQACPGAPCAGPQNAGSAHVKGFEAEAMIEPVDGLTFDGSLSYVDFQYYELNNVYNITIDDRTPYNSEWQWSAGLQYKIDLAGGGSITPRVDATYRSDYFTDPSNDELTLIPGYTLVNARLTLRAPSDDWELALAVTNLTDKVYNQSLTSEAAFNSGVYGGIAPPRRWSVSVKRRF